MKIRTQMTLLVCALYVLTLAVAFAAEASEKIMEITPKAISFQPDKNGKEYARVIISEEKVLSGYKYKTSVTMTAFNSEAISQLKNKTAGETFKTIVQERSYRGNKTYLILAVIE